MKISKKIAVAAIPAVMALASTNVDSKIFLIFMIDQWFLWTFIKSNLLLFRRFLLIFKFRVIF